ncbi:Retinol dehydrogenase 13 [Tupaia chinensis]|uniref:Retinol dehydrogenase 13 n=1 Tax=Tupaia chinensis TaxID=246437 RepID=L9KP73_TUPCH|nr:Retinol dehydrogenase 13 [Tupaia chinensis]
MACGGVSRLQASAVPRHICVVAVAVPLLCTAAHGWSRHDKETVTEEDYVSGGACPSKATIPGKTVIVTGANTGIGKQTALELAKRGGSVILACRDMEKCETAARDIRGETLNHRVRARHLDLASLKSIREFAAKIIEGGSVILACRDMEKCETAARDIRGENLNQRVILACRDMEKCETAARDIRGETLNHRVRARHLDLASLKSIREFAAKIIEEEERVDILVNNAAVMRCPHWTTEDGFEMQFGVNHLGHFLLTNLLLDKLKASAPSRIINLSSLAHVAGHIDFDDLNWQKRKFDTKAAYCQSKLAVVLFTRELSRRLQGAPPPLLLCLRGLPGAPARRGVASVPEQHGERARTARCRWCQAPVGNPAAPARQPASQVSVPAGGGKRSSWGSGPVALWGGFDPQGTSAGVWYLGCASCSCSLRVWLGSGTGVTANALHPGVARTELGRHTGMHSSTFSSLTLGPVFWLLVKSPQLAAQPSTYLAVAEELEGVSGKYFDGLTERAPAPEAEDEEIARRLWAESARLALPSFLVPLWEPVTVRCQGPPGVDSYRLERLRPTEYKDQATLVIPAMKAEFAGRYRCFYQMGAGWSPASEQLELVATGRAFDKPSLSARPSTEVSPGGRVTLQCRATYGFDRFALYKEGDPRTSQRPGKWYEADFSLGAVTPAVGGTYRCYSFSSKSPYLWSAPSDPLELTVTESVLQKSKIILMSRLQDDYDPYVVEEPSDEELAWSSSEDEVDVLLHGTPDQKRKLTRECLTGESESSSEDEFEKEMEAELNSTITTMEDKLSSLGTGPSSGHGEVGTAPTKYYDDRYSGSDSEDEEKAAQADEKKEKKRHRIPTNDELLYDPGSMHREEVMVWGSRGHVNSPFRTVTLSCIALHDHTVS